MNIIIGRKEIMAHLRVLDWRTVRKWKREYKFPLNHLPNGKPCIIPEEVKVWVVTYTERRKLRAKS
jgi:hypothetical protein